MPTATPDRPARLGMNGPTAAAIRRGRALGWTVPALARVYDLPPDVVRRALAGETAHGERGAERDRRRDRRADRDAELARLRRAGWSVGAIAARFGVAESTVSRATADAAAELYRGPRDAAAAAPPPAIVAPPAAAPAIVAAPPATPREPGPWRYHDAPAIGSRHGRAKLTEGDVEALRALRAADPRRWTYPALARRFGISRSNVFHVLAGRTWGHVPPAPRGPRA